MLRADAFPELSPNEAAETRTYPHFSLCRRQPPSCLLDTKKIYFIPLRLPFSIHAKHLGIAPRALMNCKKISLVAFRARIYFP
jgi:hypothetical protein